MKHLLLKVALPAICWLSLSPAVQGQQKFIVKGKIDEYKKGMKIHLTYQSKVLDSAILRNGTFELKGTMDKPVSVTISIPPVKMENLEIGKPVQRFDARSFYLSEGITTIRGKNLAGAVVHNPVEDSYQELEKLRKPVSDSLSFVRSRMYINKDSVDELIPVKNALYQQYQQIELDFIKKHPDSYISMYVVSGHAIVIDNVAMFESMFNALSPAFRNAEEGQQMKKKLEEAKRVDIGKPAVDFTQMDKHDKPFSLSSLKGKYVLIDFWASWCGPCKLEYPYLKEAYEKYKGSNFEIVGVSLDSKKETWLKAIEENGFEWVEVCDLNGFENEVAMAYGIHAIPQVFLVDPQGTIIAKNLRGDELLAKLAAVLQPEQ